MKIPKEKLFTLLLAIPILEIAVFGYLYLGGTREQGALATEYDSSYTMLKTLLKTDYKLETQVLNDEFGKARVKAFDAGKLLTASLDPTEIYHELYTLADENGVSVIAITSSGETLKSINEYGFGTLPLDLNISGGIDNINDFVSALSSGFHTAVVNSVYITSGATNGYQEDTAVMNVNIYSYRGN